VSTTLHLDDVGLRLLQNYDQAWEDEHAERWGANNAFAWDQQPETRSPRMVELMHVLREAETALVDHVRFLTQHPDYGTLYSALPLTFSEDITWLGMERHRLAHLIWLQYRRPLVMSEVS
jgi:hypothetical protein